MRPWLFMAPALVVMSLSAFIPLMTVVNYSLHTVMAGGNVEFVGAENYAEILQDKDFRGALMRQFAFSLCVLLVQIPLGIGLALCMPRKGVGAAVAMVLLGIPLLIPYKVVGVTWQLFSQVGVGVIPRFLGLFGYEYNVSLDRYDAMATLLVLDTWHWTPLVILLVYAGLQSIPDAYYRAARIDGASAWATFRYVTLPKLRPVLIIAVLLRFMDSFKIYSEPLQLTGGGPGNATTYLSLLIVPRAEAFNLGYAGAASVVYLYIVLVSSYILFQAMSQQDREARP